MKQRMGFSLPAIFTLGLSLGLTFGLAGCSTKTENSLRAVEGPTNLELVEFHNRLASGGDLSPSGIKTLGQNANQDPSLEELFKLLDKYSVECVQHLGVLRKDGYELKIADVAEDPKKPSGATIQVAYFIKKSSNKKDLIVFFNGGPAASSHSSLEILDEVGKKNGLDFIFIDQRGTGCSSPFPAIGDMAKLQDYGSRGIVADAEAIRSSLIGGRTWKVFGQSYGGQIVQRYIETAPSGILSATAHGYSPMADTAEWMYHRLNNQELVFKEYLKKYPKDGMTLKLARTLISAKDCFDTNGYQVCGPNILDSLNLLLGFHDSWDDLHSWIDALVDATDPKNPAINTSNLDEIVKYFVSEFTEGGHAGIALGVVDMGGDDDRETCRKEALVERALKVDLSMNNINECRLMTDLNFKSKVDTSMLKTELQDLSVMKTNLQTYKFPYFLFSGRLDAFVPPAVFTEQLTALGSLVNYKSFPNSGHEGFYKEPDVLKTLK